MKIHFFQLYGVLGFWGDDLEAYCRDFEIMNTLLEMLATSTDDAIIKNLLEAIVSVFKKYDIWSQMIFYCKPYCKVQNNMDKKAQNQNQFGGAAGGYGVSNYQETVSRPAFIAQEKVKETEVYLNGEVNNFTRKG